MTQKVLKVGKSAAVTIPKESLNDLGLKVGDSVNVDIDKQERTFIVRPLAKVDRELMDWTDKFIAKYRSALETLAKK